MQGLATPVPAHVGASLLLARFLDQMLADRPARRVEVFRILYFKLCIRV